MSKTYENFKNKFSTFYTFNSRYVNHIMNEYGGR